MHTRYSAPAQSSTPSCSSAKQLFAAGLEGYPGIDADTRAAIDSGSALALFPRFAAQPAS